MGRALCLSALILAASAVAAHAQKPAEPKGAAMKCSAWDTKTMGGPKDSVVTTSALEATADGKGWTLKLANNPNGIPVRVITTGGDSMVMEAGPFPSVLRPGQTVTTLRTVEHMKGNKLTGTVEAHYSSGDVFHGKMEGTCRK